jgi:3-dehydroquinate synthase
MKLGKPLIKELDNFRLLAKTEVANSKLMSKVTETLLYLGSRSHAIRLGHGLLVKDLPRHHVLSDRRILVVVDAKLKRLAKQLVRQLGSRCVGMALLSGGEKTKNLSTLPKLYEAAAKARLDRESVVIAMGGGVLGDVAGFFAATYLRGIRIVHVPTTLVAQVDSAIGGKTGVNLPVGKNLVGAFHQPSLVFVDPAILRTLSERQFRSGLAEVIKYGVISDPQLFKRLEARMDRILSRDPKELSWVIHRCCAIKAKVVSRDEHETSGLRAILNFGHTIGHGIEAAAHYELLHGEAIALGMIGAVDLSQKLLKLSKVAAERIKTLIEKAGLPTRLNARYKDAQILNAMKLDKKVSKGKIRFVLAQRIGSVKTGIPVSEEQVREVLAHLRA